MGAEHDVAQRNDPDLRLGPRPSGRRPRQDMTEPDRVDVLGVGISAVSMDMAVDTITGWIEQGNQTYVCVTGVHGVMESRRDPELRKIHNASGMTTPDGMPMVWAG